MRKAIGLGLLFSMLSPIASGQVCQVEPLPNALTEESAAFLGSVTQLVHPLTEGPWLDLYVSSMPNGHFPLGDNANSGESPSEPLRDLEGLESKLASLSDRCGVRVNLDWADDFTGTSVVPLNLHPTCTDPGKIGIWLRSSLPGARVLIDCTGWSGTSALFSFRDNGSGDGGWSVIENVHVAWCDQDLFSAGSGFDAHGLVLNSGGTVEGGHQILTSHAARGGGGGNEIVAINSYGSSIGPGVPIQPGAFGKITAVGKGTFGSMGNSIYGTHGRINVIGHYFSDAEQMPGPTDRRLLKHSPTLASGGQWLNLMLVNVGARTESDSTNAAVYSYNTSCEADATVLSAKMFKTTISGWSNGYGFVVLGCPDHIVAFHSSACVDLSDNRRMVGLGRDVGPSNFAMIMSNSIWDDEPGGKNSWKYQDVWYATKAEFDAATTGVYVRVMEDPNSYESGGPGVDGVSFESSASTDPSLWLPSSGVNPDSVAILPSPGKEAYGSCVSRFQSQLVPAIPSFVTRTGVAINGVDMNRCGSANIGYQ